MSKKLAYFTLVLGFMPVLLGWASWPVKAEADVGKMAPNFTATDIHGEEFNLADQKGKIVVLEWTNHLCPFVKKHYSTDNMQTTQKTATDNGVVWVSIVSSAEGKQGYTTAEEAMAIEKEVGAHNTTRILDPSGEIGRLYGAKTTPHMFVIGADGKIEYAGAIDNKPSPDPKAVEGAENLVLKALNEIAAGQVVTVSKTAPYGCSVKY